MLTYALDEYGDFEGIKHTNEPIYIGGLIYNDHAIAGEENVERKRIKAYYEAVIADAMSGSQNTADFSYPEALHSNGNHHRDHYIVRPVKQKIHDSLADFIQHGMYLGNKLQYTDRNGIIRQFPTRKGEYHLFVILKSDQGKMQLLNKNANILAKDDYASNLYFHMANELISRLIFHNPLISSIKEISLDIATRKSADLTNDSQLYKEYKKQGYKAQQATDGKYFFNLTNADIYRSIIAEEILDAEQPNIKITKFNVVPISYHNWRSQGMEFLYLSDSICSILGFNIDGKNADEWLECIINRTRKITGKSENLVFGYDEIDVFYSKAWMKYSEGDYYKALSISFDAGKLAGGFADYYKRFWFKNLEQKIVQTANVSDFNMAVRKLNETLNNNTLDQDKCFYILGVLEKIVPVIKKSFHIPEANRILYMFYNIGVTASCHIGDSKKAENYFEQCKLYAEFISLDDYLNTRNKLVVFYCDYFEIDKAKKLADENIVYQELLTDFKKELNFFKHNTGFEAMGKGYSQRGQVYAFKRDTQAEKDFRLALDNFTKESANYKITQSYLMHYYLDTNNKESYLVEAISYFGKNEKLIDQLRYIINEGSKTDPLINMKYALYVYVRALYLFRLSELNGSTWTMLQNIEVIFGKKIKQENWKLTGHPSELIFKYMRLISLSRDEIELEKEYAQKMWNCLVYYGATENVIRKFSELEILDKKKQLQNRDALSLELCKDLANDFTRFTKMEISESGENRYQWLKKHITFMYR